MTSFDVKDLSVIEKFRLLEEIWSDFRDNYENAEIPEEHKELLDHRRKRVADGEAQLRDWDEVKSSIGRP